MDPLTFVFLVGVGFFSSFVGTNVGGGGLISIPILIFLGLPPQASVATNKVGSIGTSSSGLLRFHKGGKVDWKVGVPIATFGIAGTYLGANALLAIPNDLLGKLVGTFILIVLGVVLANKKFGTKRPKARGTLAKYIGYISFFAVGFWAGIFGGGYGIFTAYILIFVFGMTFLESAGTRKILGVGSGIVSLIVFALAGIIWWGYGFPLLIGTVAGSYLGAGFAIKKGDNWVRWLFIIVAAASALKLILSF